MLFRLHPNDSAASVTVISTTKSMWNRRASCSGRVAMLSRSFSMQADLGHVPPACFPSTRQGWPGGRFPQGLQGCRRRAPVSAPSGTFPCALNGAIPGKHPRHFHECPAARPQHVFFPFGSFFPRISPPPLMLSRCRQTLHFFAYRHASGQATSQVSLMKP